MGSDRHHQWDPTPEEIDAILDELRPLIADIAHRQTAALELLRA